MIKLNIHKINFMIFKFNYFTILLITFYNFVNIHFTKQIKFVFVIVLAALE